MKAHSPVPYVLSALHCCCHPNEATWGSKGRDGAHEAQSTVTPLSLNVSGWISLFFLPVRLPTAFCHCVCFDMCFSSCTSVATQSQSFWKLDHQVMKSAYWDENRIWSFVAPGANPSTGSHTIGSLADVWVGKHWASWKPQGQPGQSGHSGGAKVFEFQLRGFSKFSLFLLYLGFAQFQKWWELLKMKTWNFCTPSVSRLTRLQVRAC